jgi:hypothetical protein
MALDAMTIAKAIRSEMPQAWNDINGPTKPYPGNPAEPNDDQLVLFLAIARGLLKQLKLHQGDTIGAIDLRVPPAGSTSYEVTSAVFNITTT